MKLTLIASLVLISTSAHASYFSKGSWVGRLFSEPLVSESDAEGKGSMGDSNVAMSGAASSLGHHMASTIGPFALFADGSFASAQTPGKRAAAVDDASADEFGEDAGDDEKPISPENLAALMKHPTEPHYDLLRPLSGAWGHCAPTSSEAGVQSVQDRFASSDRTHLTRSNIKASDADCKIPISETRTSLVCNEGGKGIVACKAVKQETRTFATGAKPTAADAKMANASLNSSSNGPSAKGTSSFAPVALSAEQLHALDLKLGFSGSKKKKHSKKHRRGHGKNRDDDDSVETTDSAQTSGEGKERHLDLRMTPATDGEMVTYRLEFLPDVAAAALEPAPASPARLKKRATKD